MKIVRFRQGERLAYGVLEGGPAGNVKVLSGDPFGSLAFTGEEIDAGDVSFLAPVEPSKLVCIGANYPRHARELGRDLLQEPLIFLKPSTAVLDPGGEIRYPPQVGRLDYEAELALVVGRKARCVAETEALAFIAGYTCANDVTARDLQLKDGQWTRGKSFDTFAPLGPCIATDVKGRDLLVESYLNGERRQSALTSEMMFQPAFLISYISHIMTLLPGDVILTGTPEGVGPMQPGDRIEIRIEGIGSLENHVARG